MATKTTPALRDLIKEEYKKCLESPAYFMSKYVKIQHATKGTIKFELYEFQAKTVNQFKEHDYNIILKCRQMGISTLVAGYSLWLMLFHSDKNILVIATKQDVAKNLVTKVRFMNDNLPSWLKVVCTEDNRLSLRFKNGSQIKAVASSPDAGRSEALSLLIIDEVAFVDDIDEIWTSAQSTLSTGGKAILLSTPNGVGNFFHKTWIEAESGENKFNTIKLHWTLHPEYNEAWRKEQDVALGERKAAQECDCDFISSGNTVIDPMLLQWYKQTHMKDPIEKRGVDHGYWIWDYPDYTKQYLVSADVGRGDASDFSAFQIFDIKDLKQVAEYRGKVGTKDFGNMLIAVSTEFNNALLVIENANIGWAVLQEVIDKNYANLFYSSADLQYVDVEQQMTNKINKQEKNMKPGFTTSLKSRPLMISKMEAYMREKSVIVQSVRTLDELFVFIWNGAKAEAASGYNDDLVMSLAINLWVRDTALRLAQESIDLQKKIMTNISRTQAAPETAKIYTPNPARPVIDPWKMKIGGRDEDLTWLIK